MRGFRTALALAAALSMGAAFAGEEEPSGTPQAGAEAATEDPARPSPEAEPADESAPKQDEESREGALAPEVFTPTEEISEDIAVPFPVDI